LHTSAHGPVDRATSVGVSPPSVQPGGGRLVRLELAWGKLRRAWLRRWRPQYVDRMRAERQGTCDNCPHDVVDARDLKYVRNVCGYSFARDPFAWRGRLGLARHGWIEILCFSFVLAIFSFASVVAAIAVHWSLWLLTAIVLVLWFEAVYFFRDPDRATPQDAAALVAPADGVVTHIEEIAEPDFPGGRALRISIFLSVFNVHVNRVPRSGRITGLRYFRGTFVDARAAECAVQNEQLWVDIQEPEGRPLRVKQIAGALARRIVCWLKLGEEVQKGDRFGMIKFGSRTDILVPAHDSVELAVKIGDSVAGGQSVLLRFTME
jgi:phosphatidylserine decarboxylase